MADAAPTCRLGRTTLIVVVVTVTCLCLGLVIGLVLYFTVSSDRERVERTGPVGNCIPDTSASVDRDTCSRRGYVINSVYDMIPVYCGAFSLLCYTSAHGSGRRYYILLLKFLSFSFFFFATGSPRWRYR